MTPFLLYLIKANLWISAFTLVYQSFLHNQRYFSLNRLYLITGMLATLLLPLIKAPSRLPWFSKGSTETVAAGKAFAELPVFNGIVEATSTTSEPLLSSFLPYIILAGAAVVLLRLLFQTINIWSLIRQSETVQRSGFRLVTSTKVSASFSFFSYVFVHPSLSAHEIREILKHEAEHIRQQHWMDLILGELLTALMWYNPLVWLFNRHVRENHEYLADEQVLRNSTQPGTYKAVLLNQLLGAEVIRLGHSFSYSLNKKRFAMMTQQSTHTIQKLKFLWIIPALVLVALSCAELDEKYGLEESETNKTIPPREDGMLYVIDGRIHDVNDKVLSEVISPENIASIEVVKGEEAMKRYGNLGKNGIIEVNTLSKDIVSRLNSYTEAAIEKSAMESDFPKDHKGGEIYMFVEEMPEFPGGQEALMNYLATNIRYPAAAIEQGLKGRVYVQFVINTEGKTEQIKILREAHPLLDNEAYRVVAEMPRWKPGMQSGVAVSVSYTVPVNFALE